MKLLKCSDYGPDCPAEFQGESVEDVLEQAKRHGMAVHGQTLQEVNSPKTRKIAEQKSRDI